MGSRKYSAMPPLELTLSSSKFTAGLKKASKRLKNLRWEMFGFGFKFYYKNEYRKHRGRLRGGLEIIKKYRWRR